MDHISATFYAPLAPECNHVCIYMYVHELCTYVLQYRTDGGAPCMLSSLVTWENGMQSVTSLDFLMWLRGHTCTDALPSIL